MSSAYRCFNCESQVAANRTHRCIAISTYVGSAIVQVKPISGKMSWTIHETREQADRQVRTNQGLKRFHYHNRFCYRVNVYLK